MTLENLTPSNDYVLIWARNEEQKTASGLVYPDNESNIDRGEVIKCGPDVKNIKEKTNAIFKEDKGNIVNIQGDNYVLIKEKFILGTF